MGAIVYVIALIVTNSAGSDAPDVYLAGSQTVALGEVSSAMGQAQAEAIAKLATRKTMTVRNDVYEVREQIGALRSRLDAIETNTDQINKKIAGLDRAFASVSTAALPAQSTLPLWSGKKTPLSANLEQSRFELKEEDGKTGATSALPHLAELSAGVVVRTLPLPETGFGDRSDAPPLLKVAGEPLARKITFGVHLASGTSIDEVRSGWNLVRARYAAYLSELEGRYHKEPADRGVKFQLIAGPFSNVAAAIRLCAHLKAGNSFCEPAVFAGKSL